MMKKYALVIISSLFLAACASTNEGTGEGSSGSGAQSSALAGEGSYGGQKTEAELLAQRVYYFAFDKTIVNQADIPAIEAQARYLVAHPNQIVLLSGSTDERGSREYNIALGWRRAQSVSLILTNNGVGSSQIKMVSYGAEKPANTAHTEDDYAQNRRVELTYCKDSSCKEIINDAKIKPSTAGNATHAW
jgi:peptidoglycan-associated lipoprotein